VKKPKPHEHKWRPLTPHKAECAGCGVHMPWLDLLGDATRRIQSLDAERAVLRRAIDAIQHVVCVFAPSYDLREDAMPQWSGKSAKPKIKR